MIENFSLILIPIIVLSITTVLLAIHESIGAPAGRTKKGSRQSLALFSMIVLGISSILLFNKHPNYFGTENLFDSSLAKMSFLLSLLLLISHIFIFFVASSYLRRISMEKGEQYSLILITTIVTLIALFNQNLLILCVCEVILVLVYIGQLALSFVNLREAELTAKMSYISLIWLLLFGLALALLSFEFPDLSYQSFSMAFTSEWSSSQVAVLLILLILLMPLYFFPLSLMQFDIAHGSPSFAFLLKIINTVLIFCMLLGYLHENATIPIRLAEFLKLAAAISMAFVPIMTYYQRDLDRSFVLHISAQIPFLLILFFEYSNQIEFCVQILLFQITFIPTTIAILAVRSSILQNKNLVPTWEHWSGLGHHYPLLSFALLINLACLGGFPATDGFQFRLGLLQELLHQSEWLMVLGLFIATLFSCYFVVRFLFFLFAKKPDQRRIQIELTLSQIFVISLMTVLNVGLSFTFSWWHEFFQDIL